MTLQHNDVSALALAHPGNLAGPLPRRPHWRTRVAAKLARSAAVCSRRLGRGGGRTIPGRVALYVAPGALEELGARRRLLLVSGTNGKTTTTRYLASALRGTLPVLSNDDGANLASGLLATLLDPHEEAVAVLEVDEAVLPRTLGMNPAVVVLLNLTRDQLDRTAEPRRLVASWTGALRTASAAAVVANADDPLIVGAVQAARPDEAGVVWVAAGAGWRDDASLCPRCEGLLSPDRAYVCTGCGFARPVVTWTMQDRHLLGPEGLLLEVVLPLPGAANRANAAMAIAAAAVIGLDPVISLERIRQVLDVAGRYVVVQVGARKAQLLLAKNPAGWAEMLAVLGEQDTAVVLSINARAEDGRDPSWLWDVPFETLRGRRIVVTGERVDDLRARLDYAEVPYDTAADVPAAVRSLPDGVSCQVVCNYSAFRQARTALSRDAH